MKRKTSDLLFTRAQEVMPGGVNSPVRAFKSVGGNPLFIASAKGPYMFDEDGNKFIDMINSWGPMILGHANEEIEESIITTLKKSTTFGAPGSLEVEIAELICEMVPSIEMVRMVNSGTEATMSAIRLARGFTDRNKIVKFHGNYHGHGDSFLISAGSGAMTLAVPDSPGVTASTASDTLLADFNNLQSVQKVCEENQGSIAAIILEPVAGNMGCVPPEPGFLEGVRELCSQQDILLIFDEVMTGFRLSKSGAQGLYGVQPDLTTLGKVIGGGMPVGAYGGRKDIMNYVSPQGPVYQAGTLSGNPVAMAAGLKQLQILNDNPSIYEKLETTTQKIVDGMKSVDSNIPTQFNQVGSMYSLFFSKDPVVDFDSAKKCNTDIFSSYFQGMLNEGVYLAPSQFESLFISAAIRDQEIDHILNAHSSVMKSLEE